MTFSTSNFIIGLKRQYPIVATDSKASQHSLLKPNSQKNKGARNRIQSDPAISRYRAPNIDHRQSLPEHITKAVSMKTRLKQITILRQEESQTATFISTIRRPQRRQSSSCRSGDKRIWQPSNRLQIIVGVEDQRHDQAPHTWLGRSGPDLGPTGLDLSRTTRSRTVRAAVNGRSDGEHLLVANPEDRPPFPPPAAEG
jgi:hypothetical protein